MLKEIIKAKQLFYRQYFYFPNKLIVNKLGFTELKAEYKTEIKINTLLPPQINGLAVFLDKDQKESFILSYDQELGPNCRDIFYATDDQ